MSLPIAIRPAREDDLPAIFDVFWDNEVGDRPDPPPRGDVPSFFRHELETGDMLVAERHGRIVGFASLITRGSISYLAELFVRRDEQSAQIGKTLLQRILPTDGRTIFTPELTRSPSPLPVRSRRDACPLAQLLAASGDRSLAESRAGHRHDNRGAIRRSGSHCLGCRDQRQVPAGRSPRLDHRGSGPLWFERAEARVGYGYVQMRRGSIWTPHAVTVGPVGARTPDDALLCACATVHYACTRARTVRLDIPGPHPALAALLDAGFRIVDVETFVSTSPQPFADPERYIGSPDVF